MGGAGRVSGCLYALFHCGGLLGEAVPFLRFAGVFVYAKPVLMEIAEGLEAGGGDVVLPCGVFEIEGAGAGEIARHAQALFVELGEAVLPCDVVVLVGLLK